MIRDKSILTEIQENEEISRYRISQITGYDQGLLSRIVSRQQRMSFNMAKVMSETFNIDLFYILEVEGLV